MRPTWAAALQWAGWFAPLVPVAVCLAVRGRGPNAVLLACAFCVSFVADTMGAVYANAGVNTWWLGYVYAPIQFSLLAAIVIEDRAVRHAAVLSIVALGTVSALRGTVEAPETVVRVIGGVAIAWLAGHHVSRYRRPVQLYCAGAAPLILVMASVPRTAAVWPVAWGLYQGLRIFALVWLAWAILRAPPYGMEVRGGIGDSPGPDRGGRPTRANRALAGRTALHRFSRRDGDPVPTAQRDARQRGIA